MVSIAIGVTVGRDGKDTELSSSGALEVSLTVGRRPAPGEPMAVPY
jgi:hypothetical protein